MSDHLAEHGLVDQLVPDAGDHRPYHAARRVNGGETGSMLTAPSMSPNAPAPRRSSVPIIRSKLAVPPIAERLVTRTRVTELLAELLKAHPVVWVCATAGAGKTTAVVQAATVGERPVAWLTLDDTDAAPGRLLTYLEATLAVHIPDVAGIASGAMAAQIPHAETAGLLAEATAGRELLLVLDGLERLADAGEALRVLGAFVRYAPETLRVLLLSRIEVALDTGTVLGPDSVAAVGEETLAFTPDEAGEALAYAGQDTIDAQRAVEVTGGWVTGVLFEAWRSSEHVAGAGGEADPLHGYLSSQILDRLTAREREFLETTALLDEVTRRARRSARAGGSGELLVALKAMHIPVTWAPGSHYMRCHPRFREYLLARLERRDAGKVAALRIRYGELLLAEGHPEDAVEQFRLAGALDRALEAASEAVEGVAERLDFGVVERWLRELAGVLPPGVTRLTVAELMVAIASEAYGRGAAVADRLAAASERDALAASSTRAAGMMAWCYWHVGRVDDARAVVAVAGDSPDIDALRYLLLLSHAEDHVVTPFVPSLSGGPLDALVMRVHYAHGRSREVSEPPESLVGGRRDGAVADRSAPGVGTSRAGARALPSSRGRQLGAGLDAQHRRARADDRPQRSRRGDRGAVPGPRTDRAQRLAGVRDAQPADRGQAPAAPAARSAGRAGDPRRARTRRRRPPLRLHRRAARHVALAGAAHVVAGRRRRAGARAGGREHDRRRTDSRVADRGVPCSPRRSGGAATTMPPIAPRTSRSSRRAARAPITCCSRRSPTFRRSCHVASTPSRAATPRGMTSAGHCAPGAQHSMSSTRWSSC